MNYSELWRKVNKNNLSQKSNFKIICMPNSKIVLSRWCCFANECLCFILLFVKLLAHVTWKHSTHLLSFLLKWPKLNEEQKGAKQQNHRQKTKANQNTFILISNKIGDPEL